MIHTDVVVVVVVVLVVVDGGGSLTFWVDVVVWVGDGAGVFGGCILSSFCKFLIMLCIII